MTQSLELEVFEILIMNPIAFMTWSVRNLPENLVLKLMTSDSLFKGGCT